MESAFFNFMVRGDTGYVFRLLIPCRGDTQVFPVTQCRFLYQHRCITYSFNIQSSHAINGLINFFFFTIWQD